MFAAVCLWASAQAQVLTERDLALFVYHNHPVVKQAKLLPGFAREEIRQAIGAFDPKVEVHWYEKDLKGVNYYRQWDNFIKTPIWIGDFKSGYERYTGINVNPENFTPDPGYFYFELQIPLTRNLAIDIHRAALFQARQLTQMNAAERQKIVNKTMFSAIKAYWDWFDAHQAYKLQEFGVDIARFRLQGIKEGVITGDNAPADTLEALLELLKRRQALADAELRRNNAKIIVSTFLWNEDGMPAELQDAVVPVDTFVIPPLSPALEDSLAALARRAHPEILKSLAKIKQLEIDVRLQRQQLIPLLDFDFKPLFIPGTQIFKPENLLGTFKVGANFHTSMFMRKERAKLELSKLKVQSARWDLDDKRRQAEAGVRTAYNELIQLAAQIRLQAQTVEAAKLMLEAENTRFENGESSLFVVTARERSLLSEKEKNISFLAKYAKARVALLEAAGVPLEEWFYAD
jgi:outer membrane protein TolC